MPRYELTNHKQNADIEELYEEMVSQSTLLTSTFDDLSEHQSCRDHAVLVVVTEYLHTRIGSYVPAMIKFKPSNRPQLTQLIIFEGH